MKICIVNPSRCSSTVLLSVLANKLKNFTTVYEILNHQDGLELLATPGNIIFKYQYLWANKSLQGADKYIIADRKDLDAWAYSSYMSFVNHHHHGKLPIDVKAIYNKIDFLKHKDNLLKMYHESWVPERNWLLANGADIVWHEELQDKFNDVYFNNIKLEKVWSLYASQRQCPK